MFRWLICVWAAVLFKGRYLNVPGLRFFDDRHVRYIWYPELQVFKKLLGLDEDLQVEYFQSCSAMDRKDSQQRLG